MPCVALLPPSYATFDHRDTSWSSQSTLLGHPCPPPHGRGRHLWNTPKQIKRRPGLEMPKTSYNNSESFAKIYADSHPKRNKTCLLGGFPGVNGHEEKAKAYRFGTLSHSQRVVGLDALHP